MTPQNTPSASGERPDVEGLAAEFLVRVDAGEKPSETEYVQGLSNEDCESFLELIRGAQGARARMPKRLGPGDVLGGRYKILESLDAGGMGQVFKAMDRELERAVALKVLLPEALGDPEREELLREESRMLAALQHPGIVGVHDVGRDAGALYVAMDLVDGRDLNSVLSDVRKRLKAASLDGKAHPVKGAILSECIERDAPPGTRDLVDPSSWYRSAATILVELARTIEAAHEGGVVHRDLKPKNIMLQGGGHPLVLDFGLAGRREVKVGKVTQGFYGSVPYVTPEQARTYKVGSDPRSDIYQLGLVLYELLTLRRTFPGSSLPHILHQVKQGEFDRPRLVNPNAPLELEAVCLKAMERAPEQRYQTARELREDLERYLAGLQPHALKGHNVRRAARATRFVLKKRATWLAAAAAVLAVVLGGLWRNVEANRWDVKERGFFAFASGAETPRSIDNGDYVSHKETIGVNLQSSHAATVYTVSIFEDATGRYVWPTKAATFADVKAGKGNAQDGTRGVRVGAGRHTLLCSTVRDKGQVNEEVMILASREDENPMIEEWFAQLEKVRDDLDPGVPYQTADTLWESLSSSTRGESPLGLSPEEVEEMFGNVSPDVLDGDVPLESAGLRRFWITCRFKRGE